MRIGEILVGALLLICLGGVIFTAVRESDLGMLHDDEPSREVPEQPSTAVDLLVQGCSPMIYGNIPRQTFSGDTLVLTMDLDVDAFTVTQANLVLTRLIRSCGLTLYPTRERSDGGLSFYAGFPDGKPLRLELKATR